MSLQLTQQIEKEISEMLERIIYGTDDLTGEEAKVNN